MTHIVLLVEDNLHNRYLATFLLEQQGYTVLGAADGQAAMELARNHAPDLVLLDIQLPGMDGYAVARALRAIHATVAVPMIAVTSYAMPGDREKALAAGCTDYIEKPIDPDSFVARVARVLAGSTAGESRA